MSCRDLLTLASVFAVMVGCARLGSASAAPRADFFVAPGGDDAWSGALPAPNAEGTDGPFATIPRAQQAVRGRVAKAEAGAVTVMLRGGTYRIAEPITFTPDDSGSQACPVTYAAYPGEAPTLSGGVPITGWRERGGGVWVTDVPGVTEGDVYFRQLWVNGRRAVRARTPNDGYLRTAGPPPGIENPHDNRGNPEAAIGFTYNPGDLQPWPNLGDVNIITYQSWTAPLSWIESLDEEVHAVRFTAPVNWPLGWWERQQRYHVENYLAALDAPGEWYLDRSTGLLHYIPLPVEEMNRIEVVAPVVDELLRIEGDLEGGRFVEHLTFRGLSFQHADWPEAGKAKADGQAAHWLGAAVFARGARNCVFDGCEVARVGTHGVWLEQGCSDNRIERCHVHDLGAGGVRIGHMASPKNDAYVSDRNVVDNCFIHDGGHVFRAGCGVWIGRSSYNTVSHCDISDFRYTGISIGWSWGYAESSAHHNTAEFNHIHHIGFGVLSDMGGIYHLGRAPGTVLRCNHIHDVESYFYGGWGLYTDEGSTGVLMERNLVYNTKTGGFHQHYGQDNVVRNNIFAFAREGQLQRTRVEEHRSFTFERNIVYWSVGPLLHGNWSGDQYDMDYNLYWCTNPEMLIFDGGTFEDWQARGHDEHSRLASPGFANPGRCNFTLRPDSPAFDLGIVSIPVEEAGLYGPAEWTALPGRVERDWPFTYR